MTLTVWLTPATCIFRFAVALLSSETVMFSCAASVKPDSVALTV